MEKLESYRHILRQVVERHAQIKRHNENVEALSLCDTEKDNYLLLRMGWDNTGRVHYVIIHLRLKDDKVWIEQDGIEYGIAQDLLAAGIPQEDICFADRSPQPIPLTDLIAA